MRPIKLLTTIAALSLTISVMGQESAYLYLRRAPRYSAAARIGHITLNDQYVASIRNGECYRIAVEPGWLSIRIYDSLTKWDEMAKEKYNLWISEDLYIQAGQSYYYCLDALKPYLIQEDGSKLKYAAYIPVKIQSKAVESSAQQLTNRPQIEVFAQKEVIENYSYKTGDFIPTKEGTLWGYKLYDEWVIKPRFDKAGPFVDGLAYVSLMGKYGYINKESILAIPYKYDKALSFSEGLAAVSLNGKWGFIDVTGTLVIPYSYDYVESFDKGLAAVTIRDRKGYVDRDDVWYDSIAERMQSYRGFAKHYIEQEVNAWQKKGKYERTDTWKARVSEANRAKLIDSLIVVSKEKYIEEQARSISSDITIEDYDADNEVFLLHDSQFGNLLVNVPLSEAENFETHFDNFVRTNNYYVKDDGIGLAGVSFTNGNKKYVYSNQSSLRFASVDIDYVFEPLELEDIETAGEQLGRQVIEARKEQAVIRADVDKTIPATNIDNQNTFAVIIANENYRRETAVDYAANDGTVFREYCIKTLGIPSRNIHMVTDATYLDMKAEVSWISEIARSYMGEAKLIFYYAGHGIPDESTRDAYLLPIDGIGTNPSTGYALSELYASIGKYPTTSSVVFLDACFSGAQRDGGMLASSARGVAIKAKPAVPTGNTIVFSAASGDETAYPYREMGHGLFTYYLLKQLQQTEGETTLGELAEFVSSQVGRVSIVENAKSQTPTIITASGMDNSWKSLKFK